MAVLQYTDTPLLFVNSTDSVAPNGRNARVKARVQQAAASRRLCNSPCKKPGDFGLLDFRYKRPCSDKDNLKHAAKKVRNRNQQCATSTAASDQPWRSSPPSLTKQPQITTALAFDHNYYPRAPPSLLLDPHIWAPIHNPSNVLAIAAFHIRRMTSTALLGHPDRLTQVLRFRQWSCVPAAVERFGTRSACLNSALTCLALKLQRMTGGATTDRSVLLGHTWALRELQVALNEPQRHELKDLFTATQLLAVFEMLDSLDNQVWLQHVTGAGRLMLAKAVKPHAQEDSAAIVIPMITDALLSNNATFLIQCNWRSALHTLLSASPIIEAELGSSLTDALQLILDASTTTTLDSKTLFDLLDRAYLLKADLQTIVKSNVCAHREFGKVEAFDKLGLCLAELLALDRVIASLRPPQLVEWDSEEGKTSALCSQLLHLGLRDADGNPALELLSAFQLST